MKKCPRLWIPSDLPFDGGQFIAWKLARPGESPESTAVHGSEKFLTASLVFAEGKAFETEKEEGWN